MLDDIPFGTSYLLQTGGSISLNRPNVNYGVNFAQAGVAYYTMTGGTVTASANTNATLGDGASTRGYFTINGPGALASFPTLNLCVAGVTPSTIGAVNLENGRLAVDSLLTSPGGYSSFNFSGGTLQPIDFFVSQWGSSTQGNNFIITLSGTGATMSSNDLSGTGRTVQVYAVLSGPGCSGRLPVRERSIWPAARAITPTTRADRSSPAAGRCNWPVPTRWAAGL